MSQTIIRTSEKFTTGIVNTPLNTPQFLFMIDRTPKLEHDTAIKEVFAKYKITHEHKLGRTKKIFRSSVLVAPNIVKEIERLYPQFEPFGKKAYRYLFFELDDLDDGHFLHVLAVYNKYKLPLYFHRTMRGWHFFSIKPIPEDTYHTALEEMKFLNPKCPHVTLRIEPNKWQNEAEIFKIHQVIMPAKHSDTERFADTITMQSYRKRMIKIDKGKYELDGKYLIVIYEQNGEKGDL